MPVLPYENHHPTVAESAFIAPNAYVIGNTVIGPQSGIWYGATLRGDVNFIRIGAQTNIQDGTVIHVTHGGNGVTIGDNVTVGHAAILHACDIEDGAYIGMQACILDGARMEKEGMLAAGALLTGGKIVKTGELWAGCPAKFMRAVTEKEYEMMRRSAGHYANLAANHMKLFV